MYVKALVKKEAKGRSDFFHSREEEQKYDNKIWRQLLASHCLGKVTSSPLAICWLADLYTQTNVSVSGTKDRNGRDHKMQRESTRRVSES